MKIDAAILNTGFGFGRAAAEAEKPTVTSAPASICGITTGSAPAYGAPSIVIEPAVSVIPGGSMSLTVAFSAGTEPVFVILSEYGIS